MLIQSINPYNGEPLEAFTPTDDAALEAALAAAAQAAASWGHRALSARAELLRKVAHLLRARTPSWPGS